MGTAVSAALPIVLGVVASVATDGAATPLVLGALGSAASAYSSISQGDYQAQVASNNAQVARQNATTDLAAGAAQQQQTAIKARATLGGELASQASNGLDVNSGSNVRVRSSAAVLGDLSGLTIQNNAARAAYGQVIGANSDAAQGYLDRTAGNDKAIGSLISGASQSYGLYGSLQRSGAFASSSSDDGSSGPHPDFS